MKRSRGAASSSNASSSRAGPKGGKAKWLTSGHKWLGARVWRLFDGEGVTGTVIKWVRAKGGDGALWHVKHEDGDEEDLDEPEMHQALADFELYADDGPIAARHRPKRKSAEASATRWAANIKEYNEDIWSSADEDGDDDAPLPPRRANRPRVARGADGADSGGGGSDDDNCSSDHGSEEGSESDEGSEGEDASEDDSDERGSDGVWGASSDDEESPARRRQAEAGPPADTSADCHRGATPPAR